jgi:hypothetical protein
MYERTLVSTYPLTLFGETADVWTYHR